MRGVLFGSSPYLLMGSIVRNGFLFHGREAVLVPRRNVSELSKNTYYHVGVMIAVSLIHGGPSPSFFAPAVADYLAHGIERVKATVEDVPDPNIRTKLRKVNIHMASLHHVCVGTMVHEHITSH